LQAQSFVAFCRRGGDWRVRDKVTSTLIRIKWHDQLDEIFKDKVALGFDSFKDRLNAQAIHADERITGMFAKVTSDLEGICISEPYQAVTDAFTDCNGFYAESGASAFIDAVKGTRKRMLESIKEHFNSLCTPDGAMSSIRYRTQSGDEDSFMALAMAGTYREAIVISAKNTLPVNANKKQRTSGGKQAHTDRINLVRNKLHGRGGQKGVFDDISSRCTAAFMNLMTGYTDENTHEEFEGWITKLKELVSTGVKDVLNDFDRRFAVDDFEIKQEEDPEAKEKLLAAAEQALATLSGPVNDLVKDCEAYENGPV
jgi:hypothetical protein